MTSGKDFFKLELEEVLLTRQEIHTSLLNSEPETIEEEQITICQKQLAKALWVIAHKLEQAHEDVIKVSSQVKDDFTNFLTEIIKGMVL